MLQELHFTSLENPTNIYGLACAARSVSDQAQDEDTKTSQGDGGGASALVFIISNLVNDDEDTTDNTRRIVCVQKNLPCQNGEIFHEKPVMTTSIPKDATLISVAAIIEVTGPYSMVFLVVTFVEASTHDAYMSIIEFSPAEELQIVPRRENVVKLPSAPMRIQSDVASNGFILATATTLLFYPLSALKVRLAKTGENVGKDDTPIPFDTMNLLHNQWTAELTDSCITTFAMKTLDGVEILAIGFQNGVCALRIESSSLIHQTVMFEGPITSLELFCVTDDSIGNAVHLLVGCAVEAAVLYSDIIHHGLECATHLQDSEKHDSVLCVRAVDVNLDGYAELLIGTYGNKLLGYELEIDQNEPSTDEICSPKYRLAWKRNFAYPVHCIQPYDSTGDIISEVMILTLQGLHIMQSNIARIDAQIHDLLVLIEKLQTIHGGSWHIDNLLKEPQS